MGKGMSIVNPVTWDGSEHDERVKNLNEEMAIKRAAL